MNKTSITDAMRRCMHREPALKSPLAAQIAERLAESRAKRAIPEPQTPLERAEPQIPMPDSGQASAGGLKPVSFTVWGAPVGKPRQTQRDKWAKRPCVLRYRAWADKAGIESVKARPLGSYHVSSLSWVAYLPIPKSWSQKKRKQMQGTLHQQKPDRDNIDKAILDALFKDDSMIAQGTLEKRWDDGKGPRVEITVL